MEAAISSSGHREPPFHEKWRRVRQFDGEVWYVSIDTGESEWHRPDDPWQQTESGDGDTFFFNVATDESLWQHPLEWKQLERGSSVYSNGEGDVWDSGCVEGEVFLEDPVDVSSTPAGHQSDDHTAPAATDDDTRGAHARGY